MSLDASPTAAPLQTLIQLKRAARRPRLISRLRLWAYFAVVRYGRKTAAAMRRIGHLAAGRLRPNTLHTVFGQRQILPGEMVRDLSAATGFDYDAVIPEINKLLLYYSFTPPDARTYHMRRQFNRVSLATLRDSDVVLYQLSHPLIFNQETRQFIFDKHHEIPYHTNTPSLMIINYALANTVRPTFGIATDIYDTASLYEINDPVIYIGGSLNYGHFLTDYLPRFEALLLLEESDPAAFRTLPRVVVVYCGAGEQAFLERNFPGFRFLNLRGYEGSVVKFHEMYLTTYVAFPLGVHLLRQGFARRRLLAATPGEPAQVFRARKIFLSREGFARRRINNERELRAALQDRGYVAISPLEHTIEKLAELLSEADIVVTTLGAHTTNVVFMKPGSTFVELVPVSFDNNYIWQYNHALFLSAGLRYMRFVIKDTDASSRGSETLERGIFDWEGTVDVAEFISHLDRLEQSVEQTFPHPTEAEATDPGSRPPAPRYSAAG